MPDRRQLRQVGIMGGSFDPVHIAHLLLAQQAYEQLQLDEVWWIPAKQSPHKLQAPTAPDEDRIEMVKRAIVDVPHFRLMDVEREREGVSYTIDTLDMLSSEYPNTDFFFLLGADQVAALPKWHRIDDLMAKCRFVRTSRPGFTDPKSIDVLHGWPKEWLARIVDIDMPQIDVSSTEIRQRCADGRSIRWRVPGLVREWIEERGLYGQQSHTTH